MSKRGGFPGGMGGFGGMNINGLMKQAKKMQEDLEKSQTELAAKEFEASAGGSAVTVKVNGQKQILSLSLKKEIVDEKTGITYTLVGDYYMPNLYLEPEEKITLNKYGLLRLNYLKKHKKAEYSILFINRELNKHLKEFQEQAQKEIDFIIEDLKSKSDLTEDMKNTNPLYWVGTMNSIKNQAEEIVLKRLIYV